MSEDRPFDTDSKGFRAAKDQLQLAAEAYFRVCNEENNTQYMLTHWVMMMEGVLMDEDDTSVVFREASRPSPSHSKQMGLLDYGLCRLKKEVMSDDD